MLTDYGVNEKFQIVAVKTSSLTPKDQDKPTFDRFIGQTRGYSSKLPTLSNLKSMFGLTSSHDVKAAVDTIFNPFSNMEKEPIENNIFDSADMGRIKKHLQVDHIHYRGKTQHYWQHLLDEMFVYCEETPEKKEIYEYLNTLKFKGQIQADDKDIKVELHYKKKTIRVCNIKCCNQKYIVPRQF